MPVKQVDSLTSEAKGAPQYFYYCLQKDRSSDARIYLAKKGVEKTVFVSSTEFNVIAHDYWLLSMSERFPHKNTMNKEAQGI